jgi:outer membrane lipoprotein SlyB
MKAAAVFLAGSLAMFSLQGCQTFSRGKTQPVPATSKPPGVKVLVDGTVVGYTPVNLELARKDAHVVRFELAGYRPVEIRMTKKRPPLGETILTSAIWVPVGAVALGIPIYAAWTSIQKPAEDMGGLGQGLISITAGAILGWVIGTVIDSRLPTNYDLAPQTLYVTMEKADDESALLIIETDPARLGQLRWIRVGTK